MNAANGIESTEALNRVGLEISEEAVSDGLAKTWFPARCEVLGVSPAVIVDGAHNERGVTALCASIDMLSGAIEGSVIFTLGMLKDKTPEKSLCSFAELVNSGRIKVRRIITLTPDSPRAMAAEELAELLGTMTAGDVEITPLDLTGKKLAKALCKLFSELTANDAVISFGSRYLASEMRLILADFLEQYYTPKL